METAMTALIRALSAEALKLKRTLALRLVLVLPLPVALLFFLNYARSAGAYLIPDWANAWMWMTQNTLIMWSMIMLPLFVALETALLGGLEHNTGGWKHLFALDVPRWAIYSAKLAVGIGLIGLGMLSLFGWIFVAGIGINLFNPGIGFEQPFPFLNVLRLITATYFASWFIIAIHTWVAIRWRSFVVAMGFGIIAVFITLLVSQTSLWWLFPWALPGNVENILYSWMTGVEMPYPIRSAWFSIGLSLIGGLVIGVLGGWETVRRDVL
jgi:hypothetical protein